MTTTDLHHKLIQIINTRKKRKYIKPRTQEEFVNGILQFWETVTVEKCARYINHLKTVLQEGRKETTQERKRRRNRQKERQAEETARLQRALRDAQQRRTPQSRARDRAGCPKRTRSREEEEGTLGCRGKGHPNMTTRPLGQGCQDRGHPRTITHRETG
ncbi:unnamed protein product [Mytilus edulis]|uniref:Uncharacterized protein n=1 Tax=Mytilus edulis TaxID=6550 RepID=A0A8S3U8I8_MYTED|nr:unnamed protein product [Mytilus edulis]